MLQTSQQSRIMAYSAIGLSSLTYLPPSLPALLFNTPLRAGFSSESIGSRESSVHRRRKGFYSEFVSSAASRVFQLRASSPSSGKRPTFVLAYPRLGACQKKLYFRPESFSDLHYRVYRSNVRRCGTKGFSRRGLKRTLCASNHSGSARVSVSQSNWKDHSSFGSVPSKAIPFVARKKLRCWDEERFAGEPTPSDAAALASIEQAIQLQVKEETRLFFRGPARGDLAEIEAFCRLYRLAENLQSTVMNALRTHSTTANLDSKNLGPYHGDVLLVEEKVASGLAHLMTILHEGKSEVLGMRTTGNGNLVEEGSPDDLPPFARLRKEVGARCKTLEDALYSLLPADSEQGLAAQARMLKLKNACLDAGFPRPEGIPSHVDIPNLAPVRLRPSRGARTLYKDEDVAFWRGGHITQAGLAWLLEKGFKTIVNLREGSAQPFAQGALPEAEASGKLIVVRIPVERGSVPSKEQVAEFARLVEDAGNKPLYLHTQAGVGRASAMVSRWRELVLREQLQVGTEKKDSAKETMSSDVELPIVEDVVRISQEDALGLEIAVRNSENGHIMASPSSVSVEGSNEGVGVPIGLKRASTSGGEMTLTRVEVANNDTLLQGGANGSVQQHVPHFDATKNAFEAQRPVRNILSRKAMSKFMRRRKVPAIFLTSRIDRPNGNLSPSSNIAESLVNASIAGPANRWGLGNPGIPGGGAAKAREQQADAAEVSSPTNGSYDTTTAKRNGNTRVVWVNGNSANPEERVERNQEEQTDEMGKTSVNQTREENEPVFGVPGEQSTREDGDEAISVEGDMCASTTGVVRLQSRRKAEMFLVRTDGYSCTRERVKESTLAFTHPSTQQQMLMWKTPPRTVLLLKKLGSELINETQEVASFLHHQEGMNVMVEPEVHDRLARLPGFGFVQTFYNQDTSELHERVDFVVCLGGDGVILHASNLFRNAVPPVVSFNLGSLGFLTSHTFTGHQQDLQAVIHGHNDMMTGVYITLRMRLRCELYRNGIAIPGKIFDVLNEVVVDRGSNPYLSKIECYERNNLITKVQADGVIVATPTGSTAYSIAAGGSMVHPNVPCMLFTPICPHSLSFRPVILPDSALLELKVPRDARNNAWVSFDGKRRQQLSKGDSVRISMSEHPLPTVNKSDQTDDWFQSLVRCLSWNERLEQRPLST